MKRLEQDGSFTFEWYAAIKRRRIPNDAGTVLSHRCASQVLRGVGHIYNKRALSLNAHQKGLKC